MTEHATVSVAIPVYNGERFLCEAINSLLDQSCPVDEIRVLDNASTDDSARIASDLLGPGRVITRASNAGAVVNFNDSARESDKTARYFAWLAADDRFDRRFVEHCVALLEASPSSPACLTGIQFVDVDNRPVGTQTDADLASTNPATRLSSFLRRPRWTEFYCLYRRSALIDSPILVPEYGADVLLTWWFLLRSPLTVTEDLLLNYRVYPEKRVAEMADSLNPGAAPDHWRKRRMWQRMWTMAADPGVDRATTKTARTELLRALTHRTWAGHLAEDVFEFWPLSRRAAFRVRDLGRRGA